MAKSIKTNEEKLIENITQYFERVHALNKYRDQNTISINTDNLSFSQLLGFKDSDHWNFIEEEVKNYLKNKQYEDALDEVNTALCYLQRKATWIISGETPAFSNSATISNFYAKAPVIGSFFSDLSRSYHQEGMNKTKQRLQQIDSWLKELEKNLGQNFFEQLKDDAKNILSRW